MGIRISRWWLVIFASTALNMVNVKQMTQKMTLASDREDNSICTVCSIGEITGGVCILIIYIIEGCNTVWKTFKFCCIYFTNWYFDFMLVKTVACFACRLWCRRFEAALDNSHFYQNMTSLYLYGSGINSAWKTPLLISFETIINILSDFHTNRWQIRPGHCTNSPSSVFIIWFTCSLSVDPVSLSGKVKPTWLTHWPSIPVSFT